MAKLQKDKLGKITWTLKSLCSLGKSYWGGVKGFGPQQPFSSGTVVISLCWDGSVNPQPRKNWE